MFEFTYLLQHQINFRTLYCYIVILLTTGTYLTTTIQNLSLLRYALYTVTCVRMKPKRM